MTRIARISRPRISIRRQEMLARKGAVIPTQTFSQAGGRKPSHRLRVAEHQEHAEEPPPCESDRGCGLAQPALQSRLQGRETGKHFVVLDQWAATSKTCYCCGFKAAEMPLSVRNWTCSNCGIEHDRDINAACMVKHLTILKLRAGGLHVLSVEACVRRATCSLWPSKQKAERCEPLEDPGFSHGEHSPFHPGCRGDRCLGRSD
jgi:Putative transposase DNA-binding domain